jgi:hypothetical protein
VVVSILLLKERLWRRYRLFEGWSVYECCGPAGLRGPLLLGEALEDAFRASCTAFRLNGLPTEAGGRWATCDWG